MCRQRSEKLLAKTPSYTAFRQALRSYRNCRRYDGLSPAQWYVSRRKRTDAVAFPTAYDRVPDATITKHKAERRKKAGKLRSHADKSSHHRMRLEPGQHIIAQHVLTRRWVEHAVILESLPNGRSYVIRINGWSYLHNRRFLSSKPNKTNPTRPLIPREAISLKPLTPREVISTTPPIPQKIVRKPEEPRRTYPSREQRQRTHYQAAYPKPKKRNHRN